MLQIIREAVINAIKHSGASDINVTCVTDPDGAHSIYIRDNGIGMSTTAEPDGHYGLSIMHERAERLNGTLDIVSPSGGGTEVQLRFPHAAQPKRQSM